MDIIGAIKGHVKLKIEVSPLVDAVLDGVVEPALQKAVEKSKTILDDMAFKGLYPSLEAEVKSLVKENVIKLNEKIPESLRDFIEIG